MATDITMSKWAASRALEFCRAQLCFEWGDTDVYLAGEWIGNYCPSHVASETWNPALVKRARAATEDREGGEG